MDIKSELCINTIDYTRYENNYNELSNKIQSNLNLEGYILIKNFELSSNIDVLKKKFLELCELVGTPIGHDSNDKIIWDIKSNSTSNNLIKTYSEHSHEAELHTDSQYSIYPEDYIGLLTLRTADCGGGISYFLKLKDIIDDLRALKNGDKIEKVLKNTNFPFIVPNVFKKNDIEENEFNFGPILREDEIRFRIDTFEKAIKLNRDFCSEEQILAYEVLKNIILNNTKILNFYLEEGDLIFVNNKTALHGRSMFTDEKRHLLRIRLNKK